MSAKKAHPIKSSLIVVVEEIERMGSATTSQLASALDCSSNSASTHLTNGVRRHLLIVDRSRAIRRCSVAPGWREVVAECGIEEPGNDLPLVIEYVARPRITGPLAPTVWRGLSHLVPA